jgi:hypothetical protein
MKDIIHNGRRRGWLRSSLLLGALITVAALGLAACGGGSSSSAAASGGSRTSTYERLLAYARCMRSHGVPNYPDPQASNGAIGISIPDANSPQVRSAEHACRSLAPPAPTAAQQAQNLARELSYTRCMRSHGVPNFPDPQPNGNLNIGGTGIDKRSLQFQHAMQACRSNLGSGAPNQRVP